MDSSIFSRSGLHKVFLIVLSAAWISGCSSGSSSNTNNEDSPQADVLEGSCPENFTVQSGQNSEFMSGGKSRQFHIFLPENLDTPRPLFVSLTGTVATELEFVSDNISQFESLADSGWIVVAPFRRCATENRPCAGIGATGSDDGRFWEPWFDGWIPQSNDEGPDVRFIESMVNCIAATYPVNKDRIYNGGSSAGGTMTSRNMMFNSDLFAGGIIGSGNFQYLNQFPIQPVDTVAMDSSIVILLWGGENDRYGASDYSIETKLAAEYYTAQHNVVTVSCSGKHGHPWPNAFGPWAAATLLSHPKGTPIADFELTTPPEGFSCILGAYTDH